MVACGGGGGGDAASCLRVVLSKVPLSNALRALVVADAAAAAMHARRALCFHVSITRIEHCPVLLYSATPHSSAACSAVLFVTAAADATKAMSINADADCMWGWRACKSSKHAPQRRSGRRPVRGLEGPAPAPPPPRARASLVVVDVPIHHL